MFIFEAIVELILHAIFELGFYYLGCFTVLIFSIGNIKCAPVEKSGEFNKKRYEWTPFLNINDKKMLKVGYTQFVGFLSGVSFCVGIYFVLNKN